MGILLAALPLTSCFRLFSSCLLFWVLVLFLFPHGSLRSRGNVKIHPFFAGISWRVLLCFGLEQYERGIGAKGRGLRLRGLG